MNHKITCFIKYNMIFLIIFIFCKSLIAENNKCLAPSSFLNDGLLSITSNDVSFNDIFLLIFVKKHISPYLDSTFRIYDPNDLNSDPRILLLYNLDEKIKPFQGIANKEVIMDSFFCHENILYFFIENKATSERKLVGVNFNLTEKGFRFKEPFLLNRTQFLELRKFAVSILEDDELYQYIWKSSIKYFKEEKYSNDENERFNVEEIDTLIWYWDKYIKAQYDNPSHPILSHSSWRIFWLFNSILYNLSIKNNTPSIRQSLLKIKKGLISKKDIELMHDFNSKSEEINELEIFLNDIADYFRHNRSWGYRYLQYHRDFTFKAVEEILSNSRKLRILCPGDMMGMQALTILDEILSVVEKMKLDIEDFEIEIVVEDLEEKISRMNDFIYPLEDIDHLNNKSVLLEKTDILSAIVGEVYSFSDFAKKYIKFKTVDLNYVDTKRHVLNPFDIIFISKTVEYLTNVNRAHEYLINSMKQKPYGKLFYIESTPIQSDIIINSQLISSKLKGYMFVVEKSA